MFPFEIHSASYILVIRWSIVLALGVLLISMASGKHGVSNYMALIHAREKLEERIMELKVANQVKRTEIYQLKHSQAAQILYLKREFGVVEPGEVIVRLDDAPKKKSETLVVKN